MDRSIYKGLVVELEIARWARFYRTICYDWTDEQRVAKLETLNNLIDDLYIYNPFNDYLGLGGLNFPRLEEQELVRQKVHALFGQDVLQEFDKEISVEEYKKKFNPFIENSSLGMFFGYLSEITDEKKRHAKVQAKHKLDYLLFIKECIEAYGLHPYIKHRDKKIHTRFIVKVEVRKKSVYVFLCKIEKLIDDLIYPFVNGKKLFVRGHIIKANKVRKMTICESLMNSKELELLARKHSILWDRNSWMYGIEHFFAWLPDVTDKYVTGQYLDTVQSVDNQHLTGSPVHKTSMSFTSLTIESLISLSAHLQEKKATLRKMSENEINDNLVSLMRASGLNPTDQTRSGYSGTKATTGSLDIAIRNKSGNISSVVECVILDSCGEKCTVAKEHIDKVIDNYNANGVKNNFMVVYCKSRKFAELYNGYYKLLSRETFKFLNTEIDSGLSKIKVIRSKYIENNEDISLTHVLIDLT